MTHAVNNHVVTGDRDRRIDELENHAVTGDDSSELRMLRQERENDQLGSWSGQLPTPTTYRLRSREAALAS